jgi:predicted nucleic acid-binding protein
VAEPPAVDASPLIFLSRAGLLDLLQLVAPEIVVPAAVAEEIGRRGANDPTVSAVAAAVWLRVVPVPEIPLAIQSWDLGPGESSVLSWCVAGEGREAIIDDLAARRCAQTIGIPVRGTLGLVLLGKKTGRLVSARPVVESLRRAGVYLSSAVVDRALKLVGE